MIVTRPRGQAEPLASRLRELGHEVVLCPLTEIVPLGDEPIDTTPFDWVVVTSANGAAELARRRVGTLRRVAAIGPGTAEALSARGISASLVPRVSTQEGLLDELPRPAGRVLVAAASGARRLLVDALGADFVPLYDTVPVRPDRPPKGDVAVVASPSAARALGELDAAVPVVSIGPETTRAARAAALEVVAEAATHDLDGLVEAARLAAWSLRS